MPVRHTVTSSLVAALLALTASVQAASQALPAGTLRVEPVVIMDEHGFEAPMAVATLFLPIGWTTQGGIEWGQQYLCTNGYSMNWSARSPDGLVTIAAFGGERWEWNNYGAPASTPGCPVAPYTDVQQYLGDLVRRTRPDAQLLGYRAREDLRQQFASYESYTPMPLGEVRTWVDAGEVTFQFSEGGREMRGTIAAAAVLSLTRTNAGSGLMDAFTGATFPAYAATAPRDRFDAALFEAIRRSIKTDPRWQARIAGHNLTIAQIAQREAQKRSRIIAETNAEIARIRDDAWNTYQESADRRAREFSEVIRGVESYQDANAPGGQTELSNLYDYAWRLNDGTYVLSDDASFEPYRDIGIDGARLEPVR